MSNPRFLELLADYAKFDTVTLACAGLALGCVLIGCAIWAGNRRGMKLVQFPHYLASLAIGWLVILAGCLSTLLAQS
jgi:hypothetical protein